MLQILKARQIMIKSILLRQFQKIWLLIFSLAIISLVSCIPQKRLILMQYDEIIDSTYANTFEGTNYTDSIYRIQTNDYLYISITSVQKKTTAFFEPLTAVNYITGENQSLTGYAVNDGGYIDFPYIGKIHLQGQTLEEAIITVSDASKSLVGTARVEIRLINNTISVMGEVVKQGNFRITKSKVDIYEAISLANGFTDYAKRNKIKVLRTTNGEKKLYLVNLNDGKLIGKNMFYVYPNDVIYVEPMRAKSIGLTPTFSLTLITTVITLVVLIQSVSK